MPNEHVNPSTLFSSVQHGFSQAVIASDGKAVFIAGQTAWNAQKQVVGQGLGEQSRQVLRNVRAAIEAAGGALGDIVALRIFIVGDAMGNVAEVENVLGEVFTTNPPAATWIGVSALVAPELLVEIEATAVLE